MVQVGRPERLRGGAGQQARHLGTERVARSRDAARRVGRPLGRGVTGLGLEQGVGLEREWLDGADGGRSEGGERGGGGVDGEGRAAHCPAVGDDRRAAQVAQAGQGGRVPVEHAASADRWPVVRHA